MKQIELSYHNNKKNILVNGLMQHKVINLDIEMQYLEHFMLNIQNMLYIIEKDYYDLLDKLNSFIIKKTPK